MGRFIEGWWYPDDQVERLADGSWRVKSQVTPISVIEGNDGTGPEKEGPVVVVEDDQEPAGPDEEAPVVKDEDLSIPGPTPPADYETKVIAAKPKPKPGTGKDGGYDTKD